MKCLTYKMSNVQDLFVAFIPNSKFRERNWRALDLVTADIIADNTLADIIDDPVRDDNENNLWQSQQLLEPDQTFVVLI